MPPRNPLQVRDKPAVTTALPRFAAIGVVGVGVNQLMLFLLHGVANLPLVLASALATETTIVHNYAGNELITFHHRRLHFGRLLRFNAVSLGALVLTVGTLWVLTEISPWHYLVDNLVAVGVGSGWNFAVNFGWTWRR